VANRLGFTSWSGTAGASISYCAGLILVIEEGGAWVDRHLGVFLFLCLFYYFFLHGRIYTGGASVRQDIQDIQDIQ
jgi:hypothetical protein